MSTIGETGYPMQGDTWRNAKGIDVLTVVLVTPKGMIHYVEQPNRSKIEDVIAVDREGFDAKLSSMSLTIPTYCTNRYLPRFWSRA